MDDKTIHYYSSTTPEQLAKVIKCICLDFASRVGANMRIELNIGIEKKDVDFSFTRRM
jgi:hypothetical protein